MIHTDGKQTIANAEPRPSSGRYERRYHSSEIHCPHVSFVLADGSDENLFDVALYHIEDGEDDGDYIKSLEALDLMISRANANAPRLKAHHFGAFTLQELALIAEALDSHEYWQLSESHYRRDGYVQGVGSDDPEQREAIAATRELMRKVNGYLRP
jgi:hypothetical protein